MSGPQHHASLIDDAWDSVVGGFHWLKSVLLGEFEDNRPLSAIIADMLVSFIPAVVIATSARDAIAVILRMAKHPEKREEVLEWVLLCACLITIALPIAMAAAGVAAAGVGAVVGGIAGSELGAALRAVMLLLVKASTKLVDVIHFLQKFIRGDILKFLKAIKFAKYEKALLSAVRQFTAKLIEITRGLASHLGKLSYFQYTRTLIAKLTMWERSFYAVQTAAIRKIPLAMAELDARLIKVLAETLPRETHTVPAGVKAPKPKAVIPVKQEVHDVPGRILQNADESVSKGSPQAVSGRSSRSAASPRPPDEKPPRKDKPDDVLPAENGANTKKQHVTDAQVSVEEKIRQRQADNQQIKDSPTFQEDMQKVGVDEKQIADMNNKIRPLGFQSKEQFERFKGDLNDALVKDGLEDAEVGLKGTSTTFYSENPGKPLGHHWDADPLHPGDFDLNVSSEKMVKNFNQAGVTPSENYGIFKTKDMNSNNPSLNDFQKKWSKELGRDVNFVGNPSPPARDATEYILRSPL